MRRSVTILGILAAMLFTNTAEAGWRDFWMGVRVGTQRNYCWPRPFSYGAQAVTRQPQQMMINAGWRQENTIGDALFDAETDELTAAGKLKVREIVTQYPLARRIVHVYRGATEEKTSIRLDGVQRAVASAVLNGPMAPVVVTNVRPRNGHGQYYNQIHNAYNQSIPQPRLTAGGDGN